MWESLKSNKKWAAIFLLISILIGIALVPQLNKYAQPGAMTQSENQFMYEKSVDIMGDAFNWFRLFNGVC